MLTCSAIGQMSVKSLTVQLQFCLRTPAMYTDIQFHIAALQAAKLHICQFFGDRQN